MLIELFRETSQYDQLIQLAQHNWLIPVEGVFAEFKGIIQHLRKQSLDHKIQKLLQKAKQNPLSTSEKNQLTRLLKEKTTLNA
jgi:DNA primase